MPIIFKKNKMENKNTTTKLLGLRWYQLLIIGIVGNLLSRALIIENSTSSFDITVTKILFLLSVISDILAFSGGLLGLYILIKKLIHRNPKTP